MPRFVLAFVFLACASHGVATIGASARAANSELMRCLDASTILGAGGDVSDQELKAAQSACAHLKQSSTDKETLARVKAAAENIDDEVKRRGGAVRQTGEILTAGDHLLHRPRPKPVRRVPGHLRVRPVSDTPACRSHRRNESSMR